MKKQIKKIDKFSPGDPYDDKGNSGGFSAGTSVALPLTHQMIHAIKSSRKGKLNPGLARYLAAKKAGKI